jgi:hypothetical protein
VIDSDLIDGVSDCVFDDVVYILSGDVVRWDTIKLVGSLIKLFFERSNEGLYKALLNYIPFK